MPLEGKKVSDKKNEEFLGLPAVSYEVSGWVSDIPMEYEGRIFARGEYVYQLIALAPRGTASASAFAEVFDSMVLDEGEITIPEQELELRDASGVGWHLEKGVFESAISGLRVKPPEGWSVAIGADAERINADAEVVLTSRSPEAYLVVIPELIGKADPVVYRADRIQVTKDNMGLGVNETASTTTLLGKEVDMSTLESKEVPWTFNVAVGFYDEWALQATGWYNTAYGDKGKEAVKTAMGGISLMSAEDKAALSAELETLPDTQNFVGENHSLRDRVFQDYQRGIRWTAPEGFWEMSVGQAVREVNPAAQLYARFANSALHLLVIGEDTAGAMSADDYHQVASAGVANNLKLDFDVKAKKGKIGTGEALYSEGTTPVSGLGLRYRVYTSVKDRRRRGARLPGQHARRDGRHRFLSGLRCRWRALDRRARSVRSRRGQGRELVSELHGAAPARELRGPGRGHAPGRGPRAGRAQGPPPDVEVALGASGRLPRAQGPYPLRAPGGGPKRRHGDSRSSRRGLQAAVALQSEARQELAAHQEQGGQVPVGELEAAAEEVVSAQVDVG
jgi:hypothetical protein